jgi:hypothetical protein
MRRPPGPTIAASSDRPQFGTAHAEIAEAESDVRVFRLKLAQQPRRGVPWAEQLDDRLEIFGLAVLFGTRGIDRSVLAHALFLALGE